MVDTVLRQEFSLDDPDSDHSSTDRHGTHFHGSTDNSGDH